MNLLYKIVYLSVLPSIVFGLIVFLVGLFGGVSLVKPEADIPVLNIKNLPFPNMVVDSSKAFSIFYLVLEILYSIYSIGKSKKSTSGKTDLASMIIIIMLGGFGTALSAFIALSLLAR